MPSRRDRALSVMQRLADERLREEAQGLGAMRAKIAGLRAGQEEAQRRLETEAHVGGFETAAYVGNFVRAMRGEQARLEVEAQALERKAAQQQERVLERFREAQVYGQLIETEAETRAAEAAKAEAAAMAEAALTRWRRA